MKAVNFIGCNVVFGANQQEYNPVPALKTEDGLVVTCFELTDEEVEQVIKNKRFYFAQLTFNSPLQPFKPVTDLSDLIHIIE